MEKKTAEFFKVLHRFHKCRPLFKREEGLSNVEFLLLGGISCMLQGKYSDIYETQDIHDEESNMSERHGDIGENGITLGELAEPFGMSMSAISKKISILEKKGLIKRENSKTDRRNVYISLTEKGEDICQKEQKKKSEWMSELIARMGEEDSNKLLELLDKVFDIIEEMEKKQ